jgi:hypothetical protein
MYGAKKLNRIKAGSNSLFRIHNFKTFQALDLVL